MLYNLVKPFLKGIESLVYMQVFEQSAEHIVHKLLDLWDLEHSQRNRSHKDTNPKRPTLPIRLTALLVQITVQENLDKTAE